MSLKTIALLGVCLLVVACTRITQENYSKIKVGMDHNAVEALIGKPTECSAALGVSSCKWVDGVSSISVQYAGDRVAIYSADGLK